jgi:ABC-2 type transport system permease protein
MTPPDTAVAHNPGSIDALPPTGPLPYLRPIGPVAVTRKYAKVFRASLVERMTYRGDFILGTFLRFLPMLTTILLWHAIYHGSGEQSLSGFSYNEMISYLLLVNISRMFSSMPGLAGGIAREIRDGTLKKYLLQPLDMIGYLVSYRAAHKVSYITASALPYALLFFLCRGFFAGNVPTDPLTWLAYAASLIMAFLVGFFFEASVGMVGFWFLEVTSLLYIVMTLNFFISGHMLPLDLLGQPWAGILKALPFQYMAYFPAVVFLRKVTGQELLIGLAVEFCWVIFFIVLSRILFRRGLRRYSAFGG